MSYTVTLTTAPQIDVREATPDLMPPQVTDLLESFPPGSILTIIRPDGATYTWAAVDEEG